MAAKPKIIAVVGPTASGKSDYAVRIAKWLSEPRQRKTFGYNGAEIISADSRQVYTGLDVGSGKVPRDNPKGAYIYKGVVHHLLDVASPKRTFTAAHYQKLAERAVEKIISAGKVPIICGGTGFYIDSLLAGQSMPDVPPDPKLRRKLEKFPTDELFARLKKLDPKRAQDIDRHNRRRLIRSLEIVIKTGEPIKPVNRSDPYEVLYIGINPPKEVLHQRIHKRLLVRLRQGMLNEVEALKKSGVGWKRLDDLGLEYRYLSRHLRGLIDRKEMLSSLEQEIREYAKRQMTWFKRNKKINWIDDPGLDFKPAITRFLK